MDGNERHLDVVLTSHMSSDDAEAGVEDDGLPNLMPTHDVISVIGQGTFGKVVLAKDQRISGHPLVAIKLIRRGKFFRDYKLYVAREILHHGSLRHPFVIGLYEVFLTPCYVCIVMELAAGGDLFSYLSRQHGCRLDEDMARYLFQQIMIALQYIHGRVCTRVFTGVHHVPVSFFLEPFFVVSLLELIVVCAGSGK